MKMLALSDMHGYLPPLSTEGVDCVLLAGDVCPTANHKPRYQLFWLEHDFHAWCQRVRVPIYLTLGNHDFVGKFQAPPNLHYGTEEIVGDILLFSWTPPFYDWAWMATEEILARKLAHLLFQRGAFTPSDMARTADMIFWFGSGVWAFCALPILIRAFYVLDDIRTPFRVGMFCCLLNVVFALVFIWPFGEEGLAIAASLAAGIQSLLLLGLLVFRHSRIHLRSTFMGIVVSIFRAAIASGFMALCVWAVMSAIPGQDSVSDLIHLVLGGSVGIFVFLFTHRFRGGRELGILFRGQLRKISPNKPRARRHS